MKSSNKLVKDIRAIAFGDNFWVYAPGSPISQKTDIAVLFAHYHLFSVVLGEVMFFIACIFNWRNKLMTVFFSLDSFTI